MNFVAHVEVGVRVSPPSATAEASSPLSPLLVGAALPDLAAIGRHRLKPNGAVGPLADGIRLHHRTDAVFHADHRFRALMAELRGGLRADGVGRGPARACGHVGVELLLDGHLLGDAEAADRVKALLAVAADPGPEILELVAPPRRSAWQDHLRIVADRIDPDAYGDPGRVAARLQRVLSVRPTLALADRDVEVLAERLGVIQPAIRKVATALVADTAAALATP